MSQPRAQVALKRSKRRSFRRSRMPARNWLIVAAILVLLIALSIYYVGRYRRHLAYAQYPLKYEELIVSTAAQFDLEPWHVAAVVRCESSFNAEATSKAGARGLMQIMPDTGKWLAGKFDEEDAYADDDLYQPEVNLKYGCWYLRWLMDRYHGDRTLATAAYHAGQTKVDQWLEDPSVSSDGKTLDVVPYDSTRTYIGRVLTACEKYQELYDWGGDENS